MLTLLHKEAWTRMSATIQVVLLTARDTKVSINKEWLNKLYHVDMVEYHTAVQKKQDLTPRTERARCPKMWSVRKESHRKTNLVWCLLGEKYPPVCLCECVCMSICVCVCVCACFVYQCLCMCVSVCLYVFVCQCLCMSICLCVSMSVCVSACAHVHVCLCMSVCLYVSVSIYVCVCVCVCSQRGRWG